MLMSTLTYETLVNTLFTRYNFEGDRSNRVKSPSQLGVKSIGGIREISLTQFIYLRARDSSGGCKLRGGGVRASKGLLDVWGLVSPSPYVDPRMRSRY